MVPTIPLPNSILMGSIPFPPIDYGRDILYKDPLYPKRSVEDCMYIIKSFGADEHVFHISQRIDRERSDYDGYKAAVKSDITHQIADIVMKRTTFTQILVPPDQAYDEVEVRARCVIMSIEELASLIKRLRHEV